MTRARERRRGKARRGSEDAKERRARNRALAYNWVHDALSPEEQQRCGQALGALRRFYTDQPEILLKYGYWE